MMRFIVCINIITILSASWVSPSSRLNQSNALFAIGSYNGRVFVVGGETIDFFWFEHAFEYSIDNDSLTLMYEHSIGTDVCRGYGQFWTQIDEKIYAIETSTSLGFFDMVNKQYTGQWKTFAQKVGSGGCLAASSNHLFISGGDDNSGYHGVLQALTLDTYIWESGLASMDAVRAAHGCVVAMDYLWVFGGFDDDPDYIKVNERINVVGITSNTWEYIDELSEVLDGVRAVAYKDVIFVIGGLAAGVCSTKVHMVDAYTGTTIVHPFQLPYGISHSGAILIGDIIYLLGGWTGVTQATDKWMYYNLITTNPSSNPTPIPTSDTTNPTTHPTLLPSSNPTAHPSVFPTINPTDDTLHPTINPTNNPTLDPTQTPTSDPTTDPTEHPTKSPTKTPSTSKPTDNPTKGLDGRVEDQTSTDSTANMDEISAEPLNVVTLYMVGGAILSALLLLVILGVICCCLREARLEKIIQQQSINITRLETLSNTIDSPMNTSTDNAMNITTENPDMSPTTDNATSVEGALDDGHKTDHVDEGEKKEVGDEEIHRADTNQDMYGNVSVTKDEDESDSYESMYAEEPCVQTPRDTVTGRGSIQMDVVGGDNPTNSKITNGSPEC